MGYLPIRACILLEKKGKGFPYLDDVYQGCLVFNHDHNHKIECKGGYKITIIMLKSNCHCLEKFVQLVKTSNSQDGFGH